MLLCLLLMPQNGRAQADKGSLLGIVNDSSGAVVPGAEIRVTEIKTNVTRPDSTVRIDFDEYETVYNLLNRKQVAWGESACS